MSAALDIIRVVFGMVFLGYAAYSDLKTRKVRNEVWMVMGFAGGILLALQLFQEEKSWEYYLILVPISILFASMFLEYAPIVDREKKTINFKILGLFIIGIAVLIYQFSILYQESYYYQLLTIPVLIVFFFVLYQLRILHGGADTKALIAIAVLMPFYPEFFGFPVLEFTPERLANAMELFFPFAFLVLMNSVLFVIWFFLAFIVYNTSKRDFGFPEMLLGYRMDINEVKRKFVWSMERIMDGERVMVLFPRKNDEESLKKLIEQGVKRIWVTPKIPFIVLLAAGFAISVFIGNILAAIFGLVG
ncbi:MAG: hypothetical protein JSV56_04155 [Methanomassiliicoccales archaeon]|nr:MAG: hypothetical protein JSV56_04155 [Methanomassiliicoccales archaeon]